MEHLTLQKVLVGFTDTYGSLSLRFTSLAKSIRSAENMQDLDRLIEKSVADEFSTYIKNYRSLQNNGKILSKDELHILEQKRETITKELQYEIKNRIREGYR